MIRKCKPSCFCSDLKCFNKASKRELVAITIEISGKMVAAQSYLRKLCRGSVTSKNKSLQYLKGLCTKCHKPGGNEELHYPRDDDAYDEEGDEEQELYAAEEDNNAAPSPYDTLAARMPEWLKDVCKERRDMLLTRFIDCMALPEWQDITSRVQTEVQLQRSLHISPGQVYGIVTFLEQAQKFAEDEPKEVIDVADSDDEQETGGWGPKSLLHPTGRTF